MPYTAASDTYARVAPDRSGPAVDAILLTAALVSDTIDLPTYAKALRIYVPATASAVTLTVTPIAAASDTISVPVTVPPGGVYYEAIFGPSHLGDRLRKPVCRRSANSPVEGVTMISLGLRMIQVFVRRPLSASSSGAGSGPSSRLDFSSPANSGYRGFFF